MKITKKELRKLRNDYTDGKISAKDAALKHDLHENYAEAILRNKKRIDPTYIPKRCREFDFALAEILTERNFTLSEIGAMCSSDRSNPYGDAYAKQLMEQHTEEKGQGQNMRTVRMKEQNESIHTIHKTKSLPTVGGISQDSQKSSIRGWIKSGYSKEKIKDQYFDSAGKYRGGGTNNDFTLKKTPLYEGFCILVDSVWAECQGE